ncbi:hypothetical protein [Cupriavidus sp. AU9028]|uniref:hypothetical protein n=1 Tax=Cupriavidus sp. AU9028 TaxID=2871157 RepID=UPI001C95F249|nr:hypothetical protein [Cupriavidus sp. AU9028]MBY4897891.1 hypothetical protein [Cupriavidus sp. AU9028]
MEDIEQAWKEAWDNLGRLRVTIQKEMADWERIQQQVDELYARAARDPNAAEKVMALEAYLASHRSEEQALHALLQRLDAVIKELNLRSQQDRREMERLRGGAGGRQGQAEDASDAARPSVPRRQAKPRRFA